MNLEIKIEMNSGMRLKMLRTSILFWKLKMKIKIKSGQCLKMLRTSIFFCIRTYPRRLIMYDTSFLKRKQVIINGDIESNPGPVDNNVETPKSRGRPKKAPKIKYFKPKKLDFSLVVESTELLESTKLLHVDNVKSTMLVHMDSSLNRNFPVRLQNEGVNVCFFNSICQVLYSIRDFRTYFEQTRSTNNIVTTLKNLFEEMDGTNGTVHTSTYVQQLNLSNY